MCKYLIFAYGRIIIYKYTVKQLYMMLPESCVDISCATRRLRVDRDVWELYMAAAKGGVDRCV